MLQNHSKTQSQRKAWKPEEDNLLKQLKQNSNLDWIEVAKHFPGRNPSQCSQRWKRIKGFKQRRTWTEEEDQKIVEMIEEHGQNWCFLSPYFKSRTGKQIRERYLNQLAPNLNKTPWTQEEDRIIIEQYQNIGGKWSVIAKFLHNRSENNIKNRFYSCLRHKYLNVQNPYYVVPEKKQKLNEEESQKNEIINSSQNLKNQLENSKQKEIQVQSIPEQQGNQIYSNYTYAYPYPIYFAQPMYLPIYIMPNYK